MSKEYNDILHYKRGIYIVDKLISFMSTDKKSKGIVEASKWVYNRAHNKDCQLGVYDLNNFLLLCSITMLGLNKEHIEKTDNLNDYKYELSFPTYEDIYEVNKLARYGNDKLTKEQENMLRYYVSVSYNLAYPKFDKERVVNTDLDDFLCVTNIKSLPNFDYNYIFMIRNAFMHSNYSVNFHEGRNNFYIVDLFNDNFTGFEGKLAYNNFSEFIKFYYGNNIGFGIMDSIMFYLYNDYVKINNENDLDNFLNTILYRKVYIKNERLAQDKILETKIKKILMKNNKNIPSEVLEKYADHYTDFKLTNDECKKVKLLIKQNYGDSFYSLDMKVQREIIEMYATSLVDFSNFLNESIYYFFNIFRESVHNPDLPEFLDGFIQKDMTYSEIPALLILKSYMILYRIQNKTFEEIDYNKIDMDYFSYSENNVYKYDLYDHFKNNLKNKGILLSEDEYQKRYFCEVIRDALAHGNVGMDIQIKPNDEVVYNFVFTDDYKGKTRKIAISLENYQKFLNSEAFKVEYCKAKKESIITR